MNKKDVAELKKNFNDKCGYFSINRVVEAYIDAEKQIHCLENKSYPELSAEEIEVLFETLKKCMSGSIGKNLMEYGFPNTAYEEGGAQNILYAAVKSKYEDNDAVKALMQRICDNMQYETCYCIVSAHCSYQLMTRDKSDNLTGESDSIYNFIITGICPMNTNTDGLYFNSEAQRIEKKSNTDLIIARIPTDGFLYPAYSDKAPDVNHIVYYTKSPKKPNLSMIEDVLDCTFIMTAESEKETFKILLEKVVEDELNYNIVTKVNEIIKDVIAQNSNDSEVTKIDDSRLKVILSDAGVSDEKLEKVKENFDQVMGDNKDGFIASNLVTNKTVVSTSEITINISKDATDKLHTGLIQGRKCLIIDLEDPSITVNGYEAMVNQEPGEQNKQNS